MRFLIGFCRFSPGCFGFVAFCHHCASLCFYWDPCLINLLIMPKLRELPVTETDCALPVRFWSAVDVWIKKPHVLNKRLCGVKEEDYKEVNGTELEHILSVLWGVSFDQLKDIIFYLNSGDECQSQPLDTENGQWCYEVRTIIPKVNSYGTQVHKEIVLKGESSPSYFEIILISLINMWPKQQVFVIECSNNYCSIIPLKHPIVA